ncbi:DNA-binding protein inhibitor ID-2b [Chelmon rostratus]|uniref:DNA-binding protein inhibitor ID-2b n=1 Tax=Chelmon rostratus TaxID=109905 RepID=UPI001BE643FE|nr:DNA-binding protein inhibitor ID-2b [Chelmon rostratus]XP_041815160.1 DNA-binding protein inhibitor ID-2b [Chelmon rostratus]
MSVQLSPQRLYKKPFLRWSVCPVLSPPTGAMRTGSPVLSAGRSRRSRRSLRCPLRGFSRSFFPYKNPAAAEDSPQVPVLLLQDMSLCYRLLRQLVPGLPPGRAASRMEILQRVIDYILDLQTELDASCPAGEPPESAGPNKHTCQSIESTETDSEVEEGRTLQH